jgi:arylsulfatase A-like enzyme
MYQQRFGLYTAGEAGSGLDMNVRIFPQYLAEAGYVSGQFGKWHLGPTAEWSPYKRGFDYQFGFLGRGAHDYFKLNDPLDPIYRNDEVVEESGYLTTRLGEEASQYIERNADKPFFAYLAFNAVHTPMEAPREEIARFNTADTTRNVMLAMIKCMDDAVGQVLNTLEREGLRDNTLIFFISDNGGALKLSSENKPLNGGKHMDYEGGIRVPFYVSWPAIIEPSVCDEPVIALDILPSSLSAAGLDSGVADFDGVNILPALSRGEKLAERPLYWSGGSMDPWWGIRLGDWKMVGNKGQAQLFNLRRDIGETHDLAAQEPEKFAELKSLHDAWLDQMKEPVNPKNMKRWAPGAMSKGEAKKQAREQNDSNY